MSSPVTFSVACEFAADGIANIVFADTFAFSQVGPASAGRARFVAAGLYLLFALDFALLLLCEYIVGSASFNSLILRMRFVPRPLTGGRFSLFGSLSRTKSPLFALLPFKESLFFITGLE